MINNKKILAIIPARGGSLRLPNKNIKLLNGKPLIYYSINAALKCPYIDKVIVSTDSPKIAAIAKKLGAEVPCLRPDNLALSTSPTLPVLVHMFEYLKKTQNFNADYIITLQPTSPFRTAKHLTEAIKLMAKHPQADSLVSTVIVPGNFIPECVMKLDKQGYLRLYLPTNKPLVRNQDKPVYYARNGAAVYITKASKINKFIWGGRLLSYLMDEESSLDIDTLADFKKAEKIFKHR